MAFSSFNCTILLLIFIYLSLLFWRVPWIGSILQERRDPQRCKMVPGLQREKVLLSWCVCPVLKLCSDVEEKEGQIKIKAIFLSCYNIWDHSLGIPYFLWCASVWSAFQWVVHWKEEDACRGAAWANNCIVHVWYGMGLGLEEQGRFQVGKQT